MKSNVGSTDKIIRIIVAIIALYAAYTGMVASPWNYVLYVVAGIMVIYFGYGMLSVIFHLWGQHL